MREVAGLYGQYSGKRPAGHAKKDSYSAPKASTSTPFDDSNDIYSHDWNPTTKGADTYTDLSSARAEAESRKAEREQRMLMERKEAEIERRERELQRRQEMADIEARRRREAEAEAEKRRKAKEERKKGKLPKTVRPRFNFEKEKPAIMQSVATAIQSASSLVNACRLVNRETENVTQNPNVQDKLDKAKAARRTVVRYIQQVTDEEYVGTLLDANEKIVEAIQLYDKVRKEQKGRFSRWQDEKRSSKTGRRNFKQTPSPEIDDPFPVGSRSSSPNSMKAVHRRQRSSIASRLSLVLVPRSRICADITVVQAGSP